MQQRLRQSASISTSAPLFNQWLDRSRSDLALLTTSLPTGSYPYAGIPWFATQFGRDAIITSLQMLWINPQLAAGVLRFLASTQAHEESAFRDSQPGTIMHETRRGELAVLREVPFGQYYGGVDTTPLFVMLAGAYESRTGDRALVDLIWDSLLAATQWIERRLDASPTGTRSFRLLQVYTPPKGWTGQRVVAKGFLVRSGAEERVTVTSLRTLTSSCGN
jgi:glycogen debranching enzyme